MVIVLSLWFAGADADECRALVDRGALDAAADCYGSVAASNDEEAELAAALVDVVTRVRLQQEQTPAALEVSGFDIAGFASSGRAELVVGGFVDGAVVGSGAAIALGGRAAATDPAFAVLPLLGGVVGGGASTALALAPPTWFGPGDVHVMRLASLLAPVEAATAASLASTVAAGDAVVGGSIVVATAATVGAGAAFAALSDVDPDAPSLAFSFGWVGGATAFFALSATDYAHDGFGIREQQLATVVTALGVNAGVVAGFAVAPALELSRPATLLVDGGAAVGLLGGAALAFAVRAPNPAIGYGTIATSTIVGAGLGVVAASLVDAEGP